MKNLARACLFGSLVSATIGTLGACQDGKFIGPWSLAPSGGKLSDASAPNLDASGVIIADSSAVVDATLGSEGGEAGAVDDAGDAGDAVPPVLPHPSTVIATGIGFGCHIDSLGNVWCWGNNAFGQAGSAPGPGSIAHPQQVAGIAGATALALGDYHACAVTSTQAVYCWGLNNSYQLGHTPGAQDDASTPDTTCAGTDPVPCNPMPTLVSVPGAIAIAAAGAWTCVLVTDGSVQCWGAVQAVTASGSVPCGTATAVQGGMCYAAPYAIPDVNGLTQLALAFDHACGLVAGNQVVCWGFNDRDQLGAKFCPNYTCATPGAITGLPVSSGVAAGEYLTCALVTDGGAVSCLGDNAYGELGHAPGAAGDSTLTDGGAYNGVPTTIAGLPAAQEIVAAGTTQAACALVGGGAVECWGNVASDAGPGVPVAVSGLPPMNALGVPDSTYACGVANDKSIWCWSLAGGTAPAQVQ